MQKNAEDNIPEKIENLQTHLQDLPNAQLVEQLMLFGATIRGTRPYWTKHFLELQNLVT